MDKIGKEKCQIRKNVHLLKLEKDRYTDCTVHIWSFSYVKYLSADKTTKTGRAELRRSREKDSKVKK